MQIGCPACKKVNDCVPQCQRCGCNLQPLIEIAGRSDLHVAYAIQALQKGDGSTAMEHVRASWFLKRNQDAAAAGFFASILCGNATDASIWMGRLQKR
ncbi:MAG: hypothetical protein JW795_04855 [Chitinivibrionales bacterium]|nr:hypothetical protein [Chitinivibrionales bacterium]